MTDTFAENAKDEQIAENANCSGWLPIESARMLAMQVPHDAITALRQALAGGGDGG